MVLAATEVWEVRTTGSDTNGGGYNSAVATTDRSQQDAAFVAIDNATITATTAGANSNILTITGYTPVAADVGNVFQAISGTNITAGFYEITASGGGTWTVTGAANLTGAGGAGAAIVGNMGGALATPGKAGSAMVGGNSLHIKSGTYTVTSVTPNVASGCLSLSAGATATATRVTGYGTTRNDGGTKPILRASGIASFTLVTLAVDCRVDNVTVDGAGLAGARGFSLITASSWVYRCKAMACSNVGFISAGFSGGMLCEATGCSVAQAFSNGNWFYCVAHDNTNAGFILASSTNMCVGCYATNNSGATSDGFSTTSAVTALFINCTAYNNGRHGFNLTAGAVNDQLVNCLASDHAAGFGYTATAAMDNLFLINCAGFNNNSGDVGPNVTAANQIGFLTLTSSPFTNPAGNDFSLVVGPTQAGGVPSASGLTVLPGLSTSVYADVGAAAHKGGGARSIGQGKQKGYIR